MILLISGAFKYSEAQKKAIEGMGYSIVDMPQEKDPLPVDASSIADYRNRYQDKRYGKHNF